MKVVKEALIDNKRIDLTDEEAKGAAEFHLKRYAFAWVHGKLTFNDSDTDTRDHEHWLKEDFSVTDEEFESLNRGYMLPTHIQLFKGSKFEEIDMNDISVLDFKKLCEIHGKRYGTLEVEVRNGVKIGNIGEVWPPITIIGKFST